MVVKGAHIGVTVSVLSIAPEGVVFDLPNGVKHSAVAAGVWIIESLSGPVATINTDRRKVSIACMNDDRLMPLNGDTEVFEAELKEQPITV